MNGAYAQPLTAPPAFAGRQSRGATAPHYYSERGISMTDQIAYQEYIQRRYNAFCKTVIRCAALDKILKLKRQWERQVSLDYLMNEKFVQFAASEPDEEYRKRKIK